MFLIDLLVKYISPVNLRKDSPIDGEEEEEEKKKKKYTSSLH